jgi:hypothetical protein
MGELCETPLVELIVLNTRVSHDLIKCSLTLAATTLTESSLMH